VRTIRNTQIHSVDRIRNVLILKQVVYIVSTACFACGSFSHGVDARAAGRKATLTSHGKVAQHLDPIYLKEGTASAGGKETGSIIMLIVRCV
jgi:hypothetical protein